VWVKRDLLRCQKRPAVEGKRERERECRKVLEMSRNINVWSGRVREVHQETETDTTHRYTYSHTPSDAQGTGAGERTCSAENKKLVLPRKEKGSVIGKQRNLKTSISSRLQEIVKRERDIGHRSLLPL